MCAICNSFPCNSRCPNAEEPRTVHTCEKCGSSIFAGEKYYDSPEGPICKDCMDEMTTDEVLEMLDESYSIAESEDMYGL